MLSPSLGLGCNIIETHGHTHGSLGAATHSGVSRLGVAVRYHAHLCVGAHDRSVDSPRGTQAFENLSSCRGRLCIRREAQPPAM